MLLQVAFIVLIGISDLLYLTWLPVKIEFSLRRHRHSKFDMRLDMGEFLV